MGRSLRTPYQSNLTHKAPSGRMSSGRVVVSERPSKHFHGDSRSSGCTLPGFTVKINMTLFASVYVVYENILMTVIKLKSVPNWLSVAYKSQAIETNQSR